MTFWEFSSALSGWMQANGVKAKVSAPSEEEFEQAIARFN